jgi:uncharacterized OB-fold protein
MSERILPVVDDLNRPFWEGCRSGTLVVQACRSCTRLRYPITPVCPRCTGREWSWQPLTGTGAVYTFAVFRHAYNDAWRDRVPYTVAIVELDEGVMMIGDLVEIAPKDVYVGLRVRVDFDSVTAELAIPRFAPCLGNREP